MSDIRVVLADDHPVVRAGLAALLGSLSGIDVVGIAADGREAVREVVLHRPNVAVLDLQMPGQDGFAATILDLLAAAMPNSMIATRLGLSPKTVANHLSSIFTKLQVADRAQAILRARDAGLGSRPSPW